MRAALCSEYGPVDVVTVQDVASPPLGEGQVRVQVSAASVNFPDVLLVANQYQVSMPPPFVPGSEFAGIVSEVASDVTGFAVGDRVMGTLFVGAFAEETVVGATGISHVPSGISMPSAAAFGVAARTAYHTLRWVARVQPGEQVIVLGAGGGVGLAAVQVAVALGAHVTAVASRTEKLDAAKAAGASILINHKDGPLRQALRDSLPDGSDVVVDPVGGDLSEQALRSLRWHGRFVTVGYAAGEIPRIPLNLVLLKGIAILGFEFRSFMTKAPDEMRQGEEELLELLAAHKVDPHIGATFSLDETVEAMRYVADGRAIGKVVLDIAPE
jgi:NADPH2:quinone reductase